MLHEVSSVQNQNGTALTAYPLPRNEIALEWHPTCHSGQCNVNRKAREPTIMTKPSYLFRGLFLPPLLVTAGCAAGLGTLGTIGTLADLVRSYRQADAAPQPVQVLAEVQRVDARRQSIQVETPDGRAGSVIYDLGTQVVHEDRPFPITSLGPGDVVNLRIQEVDRNNLYASRIEVVQLSGDADSGAEDDADLPARELGGAQPGRQAADTVSPPSLHRIRGSVDEIDAERGTFELTTEAGTVVTVSLPFNPRSEVLERFRTLRSGESVRVEVQPLFGTRVELHRFEQESGPGQPE
jgi:hypothetical protein